MSRFTEDFKDFIKQNNINVLRFAEIKDGGAPEEVTLVPSNPCQNSYSVAKAFVVTGIGMLYDKGMLTPESRLLDIMGDEMPENMHPDFAGLTIDMLLRHRPGFPAGMLDIDWIDSNNFGEDFLEYVFREKPVYTPGEGYAYSDAAYYVLARVCERLTGETLDNYLWHELFRPLAYKEAAWSHCPKGHVMGATGLYIYAADMAKLGQVYLGGGVYNGRRILSEEWVNKVLTTPYEIVPHGDGRLSYKGGMRGQALCVIPARNRAVAWHSFHEDEFDVLLDFAAAYED